MDPHPQLCPPHCHSSLGDELSLNLFCNQLFSVNSFTKNLRTGLLHAACVQGAGRTSGEERHRVSPGGVSADGEARARTGGRAGVGSCPSLQRSMLDISKAPLGGHGCPVHGAQLERKGSGHCNGTQFFLLQLRFIHPLRGVILRATLQAGYYSPSAARKWRLRKVRPLAPSHSE